MSKIRSTLPFSGAPGVRAGRGVHSRSAYPTKLLMFWKNCKKLHKIWSLGVPPSPFRSPIKCSSKSRRTYHDDDGDHPDDHHAGLERIGPHSRLQPTLETHPNKYITHSSLQFTLPTDVNLTIAVQYCLRNETTRYVFFRKLKPVSIKWISSPCIL